MDQELFVIAEAVKKIQHREGTGFVSVKRGR
jgi:hypothetical protein